MRHLLLFPLLAVTPLLLAQSAAPTSAVVLQAPQSQDCPVGLSARHANQGAVVNVSPRSSPQEQGYHVTFAPLQDHGIAQAKITLHGMSGAQLLPVGSHGDAGLKPDTPKDITESFTVAPAAGAKHLFHSTVYTEKLTAVQWIELNEVKYTDGTTWHESVGSVCRVAPNGFMLVADGK